MMRLYLLRHADAEPSAGSDEARRLTEKGREQAKKVARFMDAHELHLSLVLTSPIRRAHETAQAVIDQMRAEMIIAPWLACGMHPETAVQELEAYRSQTSIMLVGHEPDFSQLAAHLLALPSSTQIHVRKASLSLFELPVLHRGAATLEFSIPCKLM
ncbi:MAG TPA: phosphohistidine phosphatase SixA [Chthoniobacteraceae bacterium]|jgi:phosphohistidine phosphatase